MDAGQWSRVRTVCEAALERPPGERIAFVAAACADDDLRREVHAMLAADAGTMAGATELASAAPDLVAGIADDADSGESGQFVGSRVGPWKLERELGRGGMGAVYLGQRVDGDFRQCAAVKLVRSSWEAGELQRRFRSERRILAGLDHPNIARLVDGGETADGKPCLAMEYVDGQPLCAHCDAQRLPVAERLRLFLAVCAAVAHAHRSLVVHRDLKPSNVLVSGDGEVKLLDFGIARLLENDAPATGSAMRLFTPEYAAPEQVRGDPLTTSVDVYALGVMLFELLTGRRPYRLAASTPAAVERAILGEEAQRPSHAAVSGDAQSLVRLMDARLLARVTPDGKDCSAIARVLEVAPAGEPEAVEAHVLGADCERRNGRVPAMQAHLVAIDAAGLPPDRLSAYARARLDDLHGVGH